MKLATTILALCLLAIVPAYAGDTVQSLLGRAPPTPAQRKLLERVISPAARDYGNCNVHVALGLAQESGDVLSLAVAAEGMCFQQRTSMENAFERLYPPTSAQAHTRQMQDMAVRADAAVIAGERLRLQHH